MIDSFKFVVEYNFDELKDFKNLTYRRISSVVGLIHNLNNFNLPIQY